MCSRTPHAPCGNAGAWVILLVAFVSAVVAGRAGASARHAVVPVEVTVDQFELPRHRESSGGGAESRPSGAAEPAPLVAPLPPALGTGLAGLGAMALLRVGRRVVRRHR